MNNFSSNFIQRSFQFLRKSSKIVIFLSLFCSEDVRKEGFTVVIDMRGLTWHSVKPVLKVLQVGTVLNLKGLGHSRPTPAGTVRWRY
jgi:hypothetical protein